MLLDNSAWDKQIWKQSVVHNFTVNCITNVWCEIMHTSLLRTTSPWQSQQIGFIHLSRLPKPFQSVCKTISCESALFLLSAVVDNITTKRELVSHRLCRDFMHTHQFANAIKSGIKFTIQLFEILPVGDLKRKCLSVYVFSKLRYNFCSNNQNKEFLLLWSYELVHVYWKSKAALLFCFWSCSFYHRMHFLQILALKIESLH